MQCKRLFHTDVLLKKPIARDTAATDRILDVACDRFARHGYDGVNLRELTKAARVNLAAISYHFGGKEPLFSAVVSRRIYPLWEQQRRALAETAGTGPSPACPLEQTLATFLRPILEACRDPDRGGPATGRLYGRILADAVPAVSREVHADTQQVLTRFSQAIRRHFPRVTPEDFLWRFTFVIGAMQHTLANLHHLSERTHGICRNNDYDRFLAQFVSFAAAAFAPPAPETEKTSKIA